VAVLLGIALVAPAFAARLAAENGVVEWAQVLLEGGAAVLFGRELVRDTRETGRVSPLDLVVVAALIGLVLGEVDLDRILFGTKVIATKFFVNGRVAIAWRALAVLIVVGVPAAIGLFVLLRARVFWLEGWVAVAQPWDVSWRRVSASPSSPSYSRSRWVTSRGSRTSFWRSFWSSWPRSASSSPGSRAPVR
jgi:hypothetical protein